ncbi:MAG: recombinase RecT [Enterococcus gallinarum]|nr:recombinase RecT [Enterococcus gallinarum]MDY4070970.1 RecT family recombinase [Enterococcus gallinarum]
MANEMAVLQKDITDVVLGKVTELEAQGVQLPSNYNVANALKQAFFKINEVQLSRNEGGGLYMEKYGNTAVGKASIANSLLDMIQQGLNPGKNQCYFIAYGQKLQMSRSYFGTQVALKRLDEIENVKAEVIRKGDVFRIGSVDNETVVTEFEPSFENMDNEIIGAFATITKSDGTKVYTIMTKKQIDKSWSKAKVKSVQIDFPEEMAKRTVINRAAKQFINTSDDAELFSDAFNRTTEGDYDHEIKQAEPVKVQAIENKLQQKLGIKQAEPIEEKPIEEPTPIEDLIKPKEQAIEPEPLDLDEIEQVANDVESIQDDLGLIPNFGREEGVDDEGILPEEDYPF